MNQPSASAHHTCSHICRHHNSRFYSIRLNFNNTLQPPYGSGATILILKDARGQMVKRKVMLPRRKLQDLRQKNESTSFTLSPLFERRRLEVSHEAPLNVKVEGRDGVHVGLGQGPSVRKRPFSIRISFFILFFQNFSFSQPKKPE